MLDVVDRLAVIVGGGATAVRKAQGLIAAGAKQVRCVSPTFHQDMPPEVQRVAEAFEPRHLEGAGLVFAATDSPQVNDAVVREARRRGVLVNRADVDNQQPADFTTPATWRSQAMAITVSAAGSPALAATVRDDLAGKVDPLHLQMAAAMQALRPIIRKTRGLGPKRRHEAFRDLVTPEAMAALAQGGVAGLHEWLKNRYPELRG